MTIRRPSEAIPSRAKKADPNTRVIIGVDPGILPSQASVSDAITRLQRERDLALRRIDELHEHYKRELKSEDDGHRKFNQGYIRLNADLSQSKQQLERAQSLIETQKLSIKLLQEELGEQAEFDAEESPQMHSVRRECEKRVNQYEDRLIQL